MLPTLALLLAPLTIAVSDRGDDAGPGTPARPFRTLERAAQALKARPAGTPAVVRLSGTLPLTQTLELGPEASNVTFRGPATLSGAEALTDWKGDGPVWQAKASGRFRELWVDGKRLPRPTLPRGGGYCSFAAYATPEDAAKPWNGPMSAIRFKKGDLDPAWQNLNAVEVVAHHLWITSRLPIQAIEGDLVRFDRPSVFKLADDYTSSLAPYRVENVREALSTGEWYLGKGEVEVMGAKPKVAYAPHVPTLVRVKGATGVRIEGLSFRYNEWDLPPGFSGDGQAAVAVPGALVLEGTVNAEVRNCVFEHLGTWAVELVGAARGNRVARCRMADLGGGGVKIGHGTEGTTVEDCAIDGGGRLFAPAEGVWIGDSGHNVVTHNRIRDLFYTGISVGWTWGYGPSHAIDNRIEANDISDIGQNELSDMGGIYTLGVSPGTVLRGNRIRRVQSRGYGGWGIYFDEGSTGILAEGNLVMDTTTGGFHQHYGRDNVVRNNVFANAARDGQVIRSRVEDHRSFTFERNVVVWKSTPLLAGNWTKTNADFARNLFWRTDGPVDLPPAVGTTNVVADPGLRKDGGLGPAARRIGFVPLDMRKVGPR